MPNAIAVWFLGAGLWSLWTVFRIPGAWRSLTMINFAFWTGLMWPIYIPLLVLGRIFRSRP